MKQNFSCSRTIKNFCGNSEFKGGSRKGLGKRVWLSLWREKKDLPNRLSYTHREFHQLHSMWRKEGCFPFLMFISSFAQVLYTWVLAYVWSYKYSHLKQLKSSSFSLPVQSQYTELALSKTGLRIWGRGYVDLIAGVSQCTLGFYEALWKPAERFLFRAHFSPERMCFSRQ